MPHSLSLLRRVARMDAREFGWRLQAWTRARTERVRTSLRTPAWQRADLAAALAPLGSLAVAKTAASRGDWHGAQRALSDHLVESPQRFVIAPGLCPRLAAAIRADFPAAVQEAVRRADRILTGDFDLLGYQGLRFDADASGGIDWHLDPVYGRRAPERFWADIDYLDPAIGDHKIIWELNRHQHWLALGRAYWLTGDQRYRDECIEQLSSWLDANPPLIGVNWASMLELAFRSLSWIWALNFFARHDDDEPWVVDLLVALNRQLLHVERNLSYYFSPNTHLLGEALALYVAGRTLPLLRAHARWEQTGRRILLVEAERQIAPDGGHCERSTHYHRYTLDFYMLALAIARITDDRDAAPVFEHAVTRLGAAARLLADDRGRLPHIGDDDGGVLLPITGRAADDIRDSLAEAAALTGRLDLRVGPAPEEALWLLAHQMFRPALDAVRAGSRPDPVASAALPDTGYYVSRSAAGDHLVIDGGPHGYMNAGHAHADALALTATVRGTPLLIDSGTGAYTINEPLRDRLRSTALHNTLIVDGRAQSIPAGAFHWLHTANADVERWRVNTGFDYFCGSHDGYAPAIHTRHVLVLHGDLLVVADLVHGAPVGRIDVHWHLDPRWRLAKSSRRIVASAGSERVEVACPHGTLEVFTGDEATGLGWMSPAYGRIEEGTTLRISHSGGVPLWVVTVFGLHQSNEVIDVEMLPVWAEAGVLADAAALRINRTGCTDTMLLARPAQPIGSHTWRVGEIETDARMLFCRTLSDGSVPRVALVDGSIVRAAGRRRFTITAPRQVSDLNVELGAAEARLSGPAVDASVRIGGHELAVAADRRGMPRLRGAR